jgi:CO/xanthine dehydrogenase FAD-binding subunit
MSNDFDFCQPQSLSDALAELSKEGKTVPIAGGTNLMVDMRRVPLAADRVLDLTRVTEIKNITGTDEFLELGAGVTLAEILEWRPGGATEGLLRPMAESFAGPLVRNRATVGGNLCDASPAADLAPPLLALGARVKLESSEREPRYLSLEDFFLGVRETARKPDELLTSIEFPHPCPELRFFYYKLGKRKSDAISIVSVAMALHLNGDVIRRARIGLGAVAPVAMRAHEAEAILEGSRPNEATLVMVAKTAAAESRPIDDFRAGAAYRRRMVETLVLRGLRELTTG